MKQSYTKKILALVLTLAMVLTGASASVLTNAASASAKAKKVTLKLNKSKVSVQAGATKTLKITKKNVKKIKSQKWSSSKKKVATVSKKGKVTAKKAGKTTIKVKVKYVAKGSKKVKSKTLKCVVTVTAATQQPAATKVPATATPAGNSTTTPSGATSVPGVPAPTADPSTVVFKDPISADDVTVEIKSDDTTNIGEEREVSIVGGTSDTMTVKDNGEMRPELSTQYLIDNEMGQGINLGNTMEATLTMAKRAKATEATAFEKAWGQPITTQEYIDCVHSYGINTIRIPVAWTNMDSEDGTYTINEKYLGRVEEIVNYALNDGMYVIINDHWDNGWWGQFGACKKVDQVDDDGNIVYDASGNPRQVKVADEEVRQAAMDRYIAYWTQISNRFAGYSDHLIFEGANEELGAKLNDAIYSNGYSSTAEDGDTAVSGNLKKDELYEMVNLINQTFVDTVRETGGNNLYRHLLIPGYDTNIDSTCDERFIMPTDLEENGVSKLSVSVHYYNPWTFCGNGANGEYTLADQMSTVASFESLKKFSDAGYGIIIGECGIVNPAGVTGGVTQWLNDTFTEAAKYHALPCLWETGQYFDRQAAKMKYKDVAEFYNAITGANGDTSMETVTGLTETSSIDISNLTPVWSWTGKWYKNGGDNIVGDDKFEEVPVDATTVVDKGDGTDLTQYFVPESTVTPTIEGDATSISFNSWGYFAFIKLDMSKYTNPVISFDFLEGTEGDEGANVGDLMLGVAAEEGSETADIVVDYDTFHDGGVALKEKLTTLTEERCYVTVTFASKPIVTGIHIYDLDE